MMSNFSVIQTQKEFGSYFHRAEQIGRFLRHRLHYKGFTHHGQMCEGCIRSTDQIWTTVKTGNEIDFDKLRMNNFGRLSFYRR